MLPTGYLRALDSYDTGSCVRPFAFRRLDSYRSAALLPALSTFFSFPLNGISVGHTILILISERFPYGNVITRIFDASL